jgi:hypothetical protein
MKPIRTVKPKNSTSFSTAQPKPAKPVSLPREPWADTVPAERTGAGQDARKPKGVSA